MIQFDNVSFLYQGAEKESGVYDLDFSIAKGEVIVLCGESGCGKTTVTRLINGLAPEYYEGSVSGRIMINGQNVSEQPLCELSKQVGSVFQNPRSQFFNVDTTGEIAFGCENIGIEQQEIYKRIGQVASELNIWDLLDRSLFALSGGEKQKIACASAGAMEPEIFVLDEPSSNLDINTIQDLKDMIAKWKAMGKTIIIAEHRLYYLMDAADRIIYMKNGRVDNDFDIRTFKSLSSEQLHAMGLRSLQPAEFNRIPDTPVEKEMIQIQDFSFSYGKEQVIHIPDLVLPKGAIIAITGSNGAGKTTFSKCLCGLEKSAAGSLLIDGKEYNAKQRIRQCYMVLQDVNHQLFTESVLDEILLSMTGEDIESDRKQAKDILENLNLWEMENLHPMSLSGGQKQRVAIGSAVASEKSMVIFDEPTSGLDYRHMLEVADTLKRLSAMGKTLLVVTHDPELIMECCNYFVHMEDGRVAWKDGWKENTEKKLATFFSRRTAEVLPSDQV